MKYTASVAIRIAGRNRNEKDNDWHEIKREGTIDFRWRQIENHIIQIVAFGFDDAYSALKCAKKMYVNLILNVIDNDYVIEEAGCEYTYEPQNIGLNKSEKYPSEASFFHDASSTKLRVGISVLETEKVNEINDYQFEEIDNSVLVSPSYYIDFVNIDRPTIEYDKQFQKVLSQLVKANNAYSINSRMAGYCSIIEQLAKGRKSSKSPGVIDEIKVLIQHVKESSLPDDEKKQLISYLDNGKNQPSNGVSKQFVKEYGELCYHNVPAEKIWKEAYSLRSQNAHRAKEFPSQIENAIWLKELVIDVIKKYFSENNSDGEGAKENG